MNRDEREPGRSQLFDARKIRARYVRELTDEELRCINNSAAWDEWWESFWKS